MSLEKTVEATESVATLVARLKDAGYTEKVPTDTQDGQQEIIHLLVSADEYYKVKVTFEEEGYFIDMRWGYQQCGRGMGWDEFSTLEDVEGVLAELDIDPLLL